MRARRPTARPPTRDQDRWTDPYRPRDPRVGQHIAGAHPNEHLPGNFPERELEHRRHPIRSSEDVLSGGSSSPVRRHDVIRAGRRLVGAARPYTDVLVAADDVLDQVLNRPLRTWRGGAELIGAGMQQGPRRRHPVRAGEQLVGPLSCLSLNLRSRPRCAATFRSMTPALPIRSRPFRCRRTPAR